MTPGAVDEFLEAIRLEDPDFSWHAEAACAGLGHDRFFAPGRKDAVRRICDGCPVKARCGEWARNNGVVDGVWGGEPAG